MVREVAVRVSPAWAQRGVVVTKSMFREPIMARWGWGIPKLIVMVE